MVMLGEKHPSAAKAARIGGFGCDTAEAMPFQNAFLGHALARTSEKICKRLGDELDRKGCRHPQEIHTRPLRTS
jgi:hypothetical protein